MKKLRTWIAAVPMDSRKAFFLALGGLAAWVLAAIFGFQGKSSSIGAAFVASGLIAFLVAAYFDRIEEAGPGGIKLRVQSVGPGEESQALRATKEELESEPVNAEIEAPADPSRTEDGVNVYDRLDQVPIATLAALFREVSLFAKRRDFEFVEAKRVAGKGNHPWVLKFRLWDDGTELSWRVSWGGQGKRSATIGQH